MGLLGIMKYGALILELSSLALENRYDGYTAESVKSPAC